MTADDNVTIDEVVKTRYKMVTRYEIAGRNPNGKLLDEMTAIPCPHRAGMTPCVVSVMWCYRPHLCIAQNDK